MLTIFTDATALFGDGSSEDDDDDNSYQDGSDESDDDEDNDIDDDDDGGGEEFCSPTEGGEACDLEQITRRWRRNHRSSSSIGEWARVYGVLQRWHASQTDAYKTFLGPLTRPFSR